MPLTQEEFKSEFGSRFPTLKQQFFKLERRQEYDVSGDPFYQIWREGRRQDAILAWRNSATFIWEQKELVKPSVERGIRLVRVRVYEESLSEYLKYEFETYRVSASFGQEVRCISADQARLLFERHDVGDFVMFDDDFAMLDHHDDQGASRGGFAVHDKAELKKLCRLRDELLSLSRPYEYFRNLVTARSAAQFKMVFDPTRLIAWTPRSARESRREAWRSD